MKANRIARVGSLIENGGLGRRFSVPQLAGSGRFLAPTHCT
jgi:hypothetical protein